MSTTNAWGFVQSVDCRAARSQLPTVLYTALNTINGSGSLISLRGAPNESERLNTEQLVLQNGSALA